MKTSAPRGSRAADGCFAGGVGRGGRLLPVIGIDHDEARTRLVNQDGTLAQSRPRC
jgi:hypothetical protein